SDYVLKTRIISSGKQYGTATRSSSALSLARLQRQEGEAERGIEPRADDPRAETEELGRHAGLARCAETALPRPRRDARRARLAGALRLRHGGAEVGPVQRAAGNGLAGRL